jgi:two-component system sensor kinase FixL
MSEPEISSALQVLRQREALLRSVLDTIPDGLIVVDHHGLIQSFSPSAERMFGHAAADMLGRNVNLLMPKTDSVAHDGYMTRYMQTGERRIIGIGRVLVGLRADGSTFPMELQIGEMQVEGAHLFTGFVRDLTERQRRDRRVAELQAELIHVSRLSELGQMVSTLAHEVNQPLTAIANYISGIRRLLPADAAPALRHAIDRIGEQDARARAIVQSLRDLVKKQQRPRTMEDLEKIILETSALALLGTGRSVNLDLRVAPDANQATVDKVQIQQVLLNLMRNAVEAMKGCETRLLSVTTRRLAGTPEQVEIEIADTGPGLAADVRDKLFQPFVTTKAEGLGIGLSICRTIIEAHGGALVAADADGRGRRAGAVFRISLPVRPEQAADMDQLPKLSK